MNPICRGRPLSLRIALIEINFAKWNPLLGQNSSSHIFPLYAVATFLEVCLNDIQLIIYQEISQYRVRFAMFRIILQLIMNISIDTSNFHAILVS